MGLYDPVDQCVTDAILDWNAIDDGARDEDWLRQLHRAFEVHDSGHTLILDVDKVL